MWSQCSAHKLRAAWNRRIIGGGGGLCTGLSVLRGAGCRERRQAHGEVAGPSHYDGGIGLPDGGDGALRGPIDGDVMVLKLARLAWHGEQDGSGGRRKVRGRLRLDLRAQATRVRCAMERRQPQRQCRHDARCAGAHAPNVDQQPARRREGAAHVRTPRALWAGAGSTRSTTASSYARLDRKSSAGRTTASSAQQEQRKGEGTAQAVKAARPGTAHAHAHVRRVVVRRARVATTMVANVT